jgi:predicted nucleic acid-binding Zn ribbon protein
MGEHNQLTIKQAIDEMLKTFRLDKKMSELKLIASWEKVMGGMIARHTSHIFIQNKELFIRLDSAALRQELSFSKEKIVKLLNEEAGGEVINRLNLR